MGRANKYPDQFRKDALELVKTSERPIAEVARSLGIAEGTLWNWVKLARDADTRGADPDALSESERDGLRRLRKENIELQTDKEILRRAADLLNRNFVAVAPNQRWVADITEFPTGAGKLYLAGIRDLHHRGIVGWDTSGRQDAAVVVSALTMALARTGHPDGVVHHADKGSQYTSLDFAFAAGNADMTLSFGSTGDAFDNAAMETFWARLKVEIAWIRGSIWFPTTDNQICHNPVSKKPVQLPVRLRADWVVITQNCHPVHLGFRNPTAQPGAHLLRRAP